MYKPLSHIEFITMQRNIKRLSYMLLSPHLAQFLRVHGYENEIKRYYEMASKTSLVDELQYKQMYRKYISREEYDKISYQIFNYIEDVNNKASRLSKKEYALAYKERYVPMMSMPKVGNTKKEKPIKEKKELSYEEKLNLAPVKISYKKPHEKAPIDKPTVTPKVIIPRPNKKVKKVSRTKRELSDEPFHKQAEFNVNKLASKNQIGAIVNGHVSTKKIKDKNGNWTDKSGSNRLSHLYKTFNSNKSPSDEKIVSSIIATINDTNFLKDDVAFKRSKLSNKNVNIEVKNIQGSSNQIDGIINNSTKGNVNKIIYSLFFSHKNKERIDVSERISSIINDDKYKEKINKALNDEIKRQITSPSIGQRERFRIAVTETQRDGGKHPKIIWIKLEKKLKDVNFYLNTSSHTKRAISVYMDISNIGKEDLLDTSKVLKEEVFEELIKEIKAPY